MSIADITYFQILRKESALKAYLFLVVIAMIGGVVVVVLTYKQDVSLFTRFLYFLGGWAIGIVIGLVKVWAYPRE